MFGITIIESIYIATTIMSTIMSLICLNEIISQIDKSFIKLKKEKKSLESKVQYLEKDIAESTSSEEEDISFHSNGMPTSGEINRVLVNENKKLHVRCDMLEEELRKLREYNEKEKKFPLHI